MPVHAVILLPLTVQGERYWLPQACYWRQAGQYRGGLLPSSGCSSSTHFLLQAALRQVCSPTFLRSRVGQFMQLRPCGPGPGPCRLHRGKFWRKFASEVAIPHKLARWRLQFILALQAHDAIQRHGDHLGRKLSECFAVRAPATSHLSPLYLQTL